MSTIPTLETARLRLRPYLESDIGELLPLIGARGVAATTLRISHPYTDQDAKAFLVLAQEPSRIWLATSRRSDGRQIGGIGLTVDQQHQHAELGYWLGAPYWARAMPPKPHGKCCATDLRTFVCAASMLRISSTIQMRESFGKAWHAPRRLPARTSSQVGPVRRFATVRMVAAGM